MPDLQLTEVDQQECLRLASTAGAACRLAMHFLPAQAAARVLAREALIQSVRSIPNVVRDAGVALAKLSWWQGEVGRAIDSSSGSKAPATRISAHPVVRALQLSGALENFNQTAWSLLINQVVEQLDAPVTGSLEHWLAQMLDAGRAEAGLHLGVAHPHAAQEGSSEFRCVAAALVVRLFETSTLPQANCTWLPLDLLVAQSCSATELKASGKLPLVISQLAGAAQDRLLTVQEQAIATGADTSGCRFLQIRGALARRHLRAWHQKPATMQKRAGRLSPLDVLLAWKLARRNPGIPVEEGAN